METLLAFPRDGLKGNSTVQEIHCPGITIGGPPYNVNHDSHIHHEMKDVRSQKLYASGALSWSANES